MLKILRFVPKLGEPVLMPKGSKIVNAMIDSDTGTVCFYAICDIRNSLEPRCFMSVITGYLVQDNHRYIQSFNHEKGTWHFFEIL